MIYTAGLSAPWALAMPAGTAHFHFVESGSAMIVSDDIAPIALHAGELLLLPRGEGHTLAIEHGGGGEPTRIVSGTFHFDGNSSPILLGPAPPDPRLAR